MKEQKNFVIKQPKKKQKKHVLCELHQTSSAVVLLWCRTIFTVHWQQNIVTGFKAYVRNIPRGLAKCILAPVMYLLKTS